MITVHAEHKNNASCIKKMLDFFQQLDCICRTTSVKFIYNYDDWRMRVDLIERLNNRFQSLFESIDGSASFSECRDTCIHDGFACFQACEDFVWDILPCFFGSFVRKISLKLLRGE